MTNGLGNILFTAAERGAQCEKTTMPSLELGESIPPDTAHVSNRLATSSSDSDPLFGAMKIY